MEYLYIGRIDIIANAKVRDVLGEEGRWWMKRSMKLYSGKLDRLNNS